MRATAWRSLGVVTSIGAIAWVLWRLPLTSNEDSFGGPTLVWIVAWVVYTLTVSRGPRSWRVDVTGSWRARRGAVAAAGALVVIASVARLWQLGSIPYVFSGDEAGQGMETLQVLSGVIRNPFATGRLGMPTGTFFFNSPTVWLLGPSPFALRLPWALLGIATVLVTYCLALRLTRDRPVALAAAAMLATYHYHVHYSRLALNNVADPFLVGLGLLCLYRAFDEGRRLDWVWTGTISGLALYGYPGARLVAVLVALTAVRLAIARRGPGQAPPWIGMAIAAGAFLLVAAPMLQYAIRFPDDFNARINAVGIMQSGWLSREMVLREESGPVILLEHLIQSALVFNYHPGSPLHYGWPGPLLDLVTGVFFMLGLLWAAARVLLPPWDTRLFPMVAWWVLGILCGGLLTEPPPSSARLLTVVVPVCFFAAAAFSRSVALVRQSGWRLPARPALAVGVTLFAMNSLYGYFVAFTPLRISGGQHAELATALSDTLRDVDPSSRVYFFGAPHMFADFPTLAFFSQRLRVHDVHETLEHGLPGPVVPGDLFILMPHRTAEMRVLESASPGGEVREIRSPVDGRLMATLFRGRHPRAFQATGGDPGEGAAHR